MKECKKVWVSHSCFSRQNACIWGITLQEILIFSLIFVPFYSVYSSPHRFKYQTASLTSQFPPGVSGVCTEPKKHLPFPLFFHILELGTSLWAVYVIIGFLVSTEPGILEVAGLPVLKNQHHLGKFPTVADLGWLTFENAFWPFWSLLGFFFSF